MKNLQKIIVGLSFIGVGAVIILTNLGVISPIFRQLFISWQMCCIVAGLLALTNGHYKGAAVLVMVGAFFLLPRIPGLYLGLHFVRNFWPLMLVGVGLVILFARGSRADCLAGENVKSTLGADASDTYSQDGYIDQRFIVTGSDQTFIGPEFKGGDILTVFGGTQLDLTKTQLPVDQDAELTVKGFCGGVTLIVPQDWRVEVRNGSIFGGATDSRPKGVGRSSARRLIVNVNFVFGGADIKQ